MISEKMGNKIINRASLIKYRIPKFNLPTDSKIKITIGVTSCFLAFSANAGVIFDNKPQLKNYAEEAQLITPKTKYSSKDKTTGADKKVSETKGNGTVSIIQTENLNLSAISPQIIALPGTVIGIAGITYLAYKIDSDFASFVNKSSLRPSDVFGAGYEPVLKDDETFSQISSRKNYKRKMIAHNLNKALYPNNFS